MLDSHLTIPKGTRGSYETEGQIGVRGMGGVHFALDSRLDRKVANRILPSMLASNPQFLARFEREEKTISSLTPVGGGSEWYFMIRPVGDDTPESRLRRTRLAF